MEAPSSKPTEESQWGPQAGRSYGTMAWGLAWEALRDPVCWTSKLYDFRGTSQPIPCVHGQEHRVKEGVTGNSMPQDCFVLSSVPTYVLCTNDGWEWNRQWPHLPRVQEMGEHPFPSSHETDRSPSDSRGTSGSAHWSSSMGPRPSIDDVLSLRGACLLKYRPSPVQCRLRRNTMFISQSICNLGVAPSCIPAGLAVWAASVCLCAGENSYQGNGM